MLITGSFPPMHCGVGDYAYRLAVTLARNAALRVGVLTSRAAESAELDWSFDAFPIVEAWSWYELKTILKTVRDWAPDVVHIQFPTLGYRDKRLPWVLPLCLYIMGIPVVQTWHGRHRLKNLMSAGFLFRFLSAAVVPSGLITVHKDYQAGTDRLLRWVFYNKTIRYIPNGSAIPAVDLNASERDAVRAKYVRHDTHMVVYFGFMYPSKQVELLFEIVDSSDSHLIIIGKSLPEAELPHMDKHTRASWRAYQESLIQLACSEPWKDKATLTGFLPADEVARVLAAADAVVLPIRGGAGEWNTSVHAAQAQGTFVLTTSRQRHGYDPERNTYFAQDHDVVEMREALKRYAGKRSEGSRDAEQTWQSIGESHVELYLAYASKA